MKYYASDFRHKYRLVNIYMVLNQMQPGSHKLDVDKFLNVFLNFLLTRRLGLAQAVIASCSLIIYVSYLRVCLMSHQHNKSIRAGQDVDAVKPHAQNISVLVNT